LTARARIRKRRKEKKREEKKRERKLKRATDSRFLSVIIARVDKIYVGVNPKLMERLLDRLVRAIEDDR